LIAITPTLRELLVFSLEAVDTVSVGTALSDPVAKLINVSRWATRKNRKTVTNIAVRNGTNRICAS
jgi:hypothetical protein